MIKCHDRCWLAQQRMHAYYVMHRWPHPHLQGAWPARCARAKYWVWAQKLIKFENVYSRTRSSEEGVRPTFQASPDRRLWRREDVRTLQIRGRHFQYDLHINHRWVSFCQPHISQVTHIRAVLRFATGGYNLCPLKCDGDPVTALLTVKICGF